MSSAAVVVTVTIKEDRLDDFLKAIETDVKGSRDKTADPGCLRFDLLRSKDDPRTFMFYEAYVDDAANEVHRASAHFKAWSDFKATGGVESQSAVKLESTSIPGDWAFQATGPGTGSAGTVVLVTVEIQEDKIEEFLKVMQEDALKSRDKSLDPGCLRFDLLRYRDTPNKFVFYEVYVDDDGITKHKTTDHYKMWAEFKAAGGVINQSAVKLDACSIPGDWMLTA